jgi:hypothetical protein
VNNDYFTIERSADGVNFSFVATVTGAGHSNTLLEYLYTDASPLKGNSYYRLKQTDFDGETSFSEIRQFFLNSGPDKLYPTFLKESDFVYRTEWEGEAKVKLYNNTGTKVKEISQYLSKGENDLRLSCSALPGGIYFVIIERNGNTSMYKAVIAR